MMKPLGFVIGVLLIASVAMAGGVPSYQDLCKDLKDLPGWKARQCTGMTVETPQGKMTMAMRSYSRGQQELQVSVVVGTSAAANWAPFESGVQVDTPEQFVKLTQVDGFPVGISYSKDEMGGVIIVCLKKTAGQTSAVLTVYFKGMPWSQALQWSKGFPWKSMANRLK